MDLNQQDTKAHCNTPKGMNFLVLIYALVPYWSPFCVQVE